MARCFGSGDAWIRFRCHLMDPDPGRKKPRNNPPVPELKKEQGFLLEYKTFYCFSRISPDLPQQRKDLQKFFSRFLLIPWNRIQMELDADLDPVPHLNVRKSKTLVWRIRIRRIRIILSDYRTLLGGYQ